MPEYPEPVAYRYESRRPNEVASFHPKCLIEEMVDRRELSPGAWDMRPEDVLNQHAGATGIVREQGIVTDGPFGPQAFPQAQWPSNELADKGCGRCGAPILPAPEPITAVQAVARDLYAHDLTVDRNDYDPQWCADAMATFGPQAQQHVVAHEALRQYREREQIADWALTSAQLSEAPQRPRRPDNIEALRARLAARPAGPRPTRRGTFD